MVIEPGSNGLNTSGSAGKARQGHAGNVKNDASQGPKPSDSKPNSGKDSVVLSDAGKSLANLEANLAKASEVDESKVEDIREQLRSGSYTIDNAAIAKNMLLQDEL